MIQDAASLENLRDIVEPEAVSWWPMAPGWWAVIAASLLFAAIYTVKSVRRWKRNAYRRAALKELQAATTAPAIDSILKRVALSAYPRDQVASLSGTGWCEFLGSSASLDVPSSVETTLKDIFKPKSEDISELSDFAADWIRNHRNETETSNAVGADPL